MLINYNLEMDDGKNGYFFSVAGDEKNSSLLRAFTLTNGIRKGYTYRFRYRVMNQIGWTAYSPVTYILAASVPNKTPAPTVVSTSDT